MNNRRDFLMGAATFAGVSLVPGVSRASGATSGPSCLPVKAAARQGIIAFELPVLGSDTTMKSQDFTGTAVWINFFAGWCGDCNVEMPNLLELEAKYRSQGLTVIGIDVGEPVATVMQFKKHFNVPYPILLDEGGRVFSSLVGTNHLPTNLFYNKQRFLTCIGIEGFTGKDMDNEIAVALGI
jgi:thiol-disulfide isomerase/thioredoxin